MASDLEKKIIRQVEYYFGDVNLPRDNFLNTQIKEDKDGWVPLEVMLKFKRLSGICDDLKVIAEALEKSEEKIVLVNEDKTKIRRNPEKPVPENNESHIKKLQERSAYAKGFPADSQLDDIVTFLEEYGPPESVIRRVDRSHKFKGSCFIVFKDIEGAKKFVELESVKYKDIELIRKMQQDYHDGKKKEIEERKKAQKEKKEAVVKENAQKIEFPNGAIVHFTGITEGQEILREEIKEKLKEASGFDVSYIDFNKGDLEGYVRFAKENNAIDFFKTLTDGLFEIGEIKLKLKTLEGDEEKEYHKKTSEAMVTQRNKSKHFNRKRKGNFGGGNKNSKHHKK
ncbi:unnamed protein product [Ceutorhynchus assimilis]|uniref:Lupus La protein n=1 Tax=Ceutorhynchus assimilis TaxID=467358 RepID=A0A9N9MPR7_9CUCU|nr:unnamed protein product [Ceutorhynchus assimilis]